jgi:nitroreductase
MSAPIDTIPPASSATRAHATNVTAPTDSYGIAQKPVPERADAQQGELDSFHIVRTTLMVAATGPGSGSVDTSNAVPFKEQVCPPHIGGAS